MLTARTFAKEKGVSYTTIMAWLRGGMIPGATQEETPMGMVWQIPASSLEKVERRKPGPKPATDASGQSESQPTKKSAKKAAARLVKKKGAAK